jgi:Uma2 family endonuclease
MPIDATYNFKAKNAMSIAIESFAYDAALYTVDDLPESDGKPMAETHKHVLQMVAALNALRWYFRDDPQMYLIGNMFVYFLDNLGTLRRVSPDIFAVRGISTEARRVYSVEKEGKAPDLVIEFTSKKTKKTDTIKKPKIYSWLGVKEYFLFDPLGDYLKPRLIGYELAGGDYRRMNLEKSRLHSKVLGLDLVVEGDNLRFYDPRTGEWLLTHEEAQTARQLAEAQAQREATARQLAEAQAQREATARQAAEAELVRLREEIARLQKGAG